MSEILSQIRAGLVANLRRIDGLTVYPGPVGSPVTPCAYVLRDATAWDTTNARGTDTWTFRVQLLVAKTTERSAQEKLDRFVDPGDERSVKNAIEYADGPAGQATLGGAADDLIVTNTDADAVFEQATGNVMAQYLGAEFFVTVFAPGA